MFAFDCLSLNGRTLLREPLTARREALYSALSESEGQLQFATEKVGCGAAEGRRGDRWAAWQGGSSVGPAPASEARPPAVSLLA